MNLSTKNVSFKKWLGEEIADVEFTDKRLNNRFRRLVEQLWHNLGEPIPYACQDWANTKAAYRFLSNDKVTEDKILSSHFNSTKQRINANPSTHILVIQDTTEFSYNRTEEEKIGWTKLLNRNKSLYKKCGILMHGSLAITPEGLPLGLCAIKFWSRKKFKGTNQLKRKINPNRVPIEEKESIRWLENLKSSIDLIQNPQRCVHVGDRESDMYELFDSAEQLNTNFLVRSCHNRNINDEYSKIDKKMAGAPISGTHTIKLETSKNRKARQVKLGIKYQRVELIVPADKKNSYVGWIFSEK